MVSHPANLQRHLESWGLEVINHNKKGRPGTFKPRGVIVHHDASSSKSGNNGALSVILNGRPGIPGPLSQFQIARDGTVHLITTGRANHAGTGKWSWIPSNQGNAYAWGIEAANNGIGEAWSREQLEAYYILCAALLAWMETADTSRVIAHKEYAQGRKSDPRFDMDEFRKRVKAAYDYKVNPPKKVGAVFPLAPTGNRYKMGPKTHAGFENLYRWELRAAGKEGKSWLAKAAAIWLEHITPKRRAITIAQLEGIAHDLKVKTTEVPVGMKLTRQGLADRILYTQQLIGYKKSGKYV